MAIFSWFKPNKQEALTSAPASSGLSRIDSTRPAHAARDPRDAASNAQPANRKSERMARRELLYSVVRESMTRAGVLSASYKFKVLSLDARARQFLVMVDLAPQHGLETGRLGEVEAMIAQGAKHRYDIIVTAVYWRMHDHVAVGSPIGVALPPYAVSAMPIGAAVPPAAALPAVATATATSPVRSPAGTSDEVAEFRRALAAGLARKTTPAVAAGATAAATSLVRPEPAASGFADTEMHEAEPKLRSLSGSQFGELN